MCCMHGRGCDRASVYQALVDYNQVGNVDVVGFYYSDVILDGISKGIISSAIALDMDEIGRYSVNALEEFSSLGHTSNYYSVGQHVITRYNTGHTEREELNEREKKGLSVQNSIQHKIAAFAMAPVMHL